MRTSHLIGRIGAIVVLLALCAQPPGNVRAAPQAGSFNVNSLLDSAASDSVLTLREAILLANGGTGVLGLNRALSPSEQAQITGCTIDGSGHITAGCGLNQFDFIVFNASIPVGSLLPIGTPLPPLNDPQGVLVNGGTVKPTIDATALALGDGLLLLSTLNSVWHLGVKGAPDHGFSVPGNGAELNDVWVWNSGTGIRVDGDNAVINNAVIGVDTNAATCGVGSANRGNRNQGIDLAGTYAEVKNSVVGCSGKGGTDAGAGIRVQAAHNTIGPNNWIGRGVGLTGTYPNSPTGVLVETYAPCCYFPNYTKVFSNTISDNQADGLRLIEAHFARVGGNLVRANGGYGIRVANSHDGIHGGPSLLDTGLTPNRIVLNNFSGLYVTGANSSDNFILGNRIGTLDGVNPAANEGAGVELANGAHDNFVGDMAAPQNQIGGNYADGVLVRSGAHDNQIANNLIGSPYCCILRNGSDGIELSDAYSNTVKGNTVANNNLNGIRLTNAWINRIESNDVFMNARGIWLIGAQTVSNTVRLGAIHDNARDGITEETTAGSNAWSRLSTYGNGGLGIDKDSSIETADIRDLPNIKVVSVVSAGGTVTVTGTAPPSALGITTVELYKVDVDANGDGEGKLYLGSDAADGSGAWRVVHNNVAARCYVAFYTFDSVFSSADSSSEFSLNSCRTFLPLIRR